jgi:uncharacterized membrane protein
MNRFLKLLAPVGAFALPFLAKAQVIGGDIGGLPGGNDALDILGVISGIFGVVIPLLVTLAVIYVIVGIIKYATASDDESQATARKSILHGIIALFVIVSIWGLVAILNQTFGVGQGGQNVGNCQPVYNPDTNQFVAPPGC